MTRDEWYIHWREMRLARPKGGLSNGELNALLKDCYSITLNDRDRANYDMIGRYDGQVSERLLLIRANLKKLGEEQNKEMWKLVMRADNPFLKMIPKESDGFAGKYIPVPLKLGTDE